MQDPGYPYPAPNESRFAAAVRLHHANRGILTPGDPPGALRPAQPAISRHLRVLRESGLVRDMPTGRHRLYELDASRLADLRRDLPDRLVRLPGQLGRVFTKSLWVWCGHPNLSSATGVT
jgi:hypothetical protein